MKYFFLFIYSLFIQIHAEITPPNYDFNLSKIEIFFPKKTIEEVKKNYPKIKIIEDAGDSKIYFIKFQAKEYTLDIYTQVKNEKIIDVYIRLPQYFHHDLVLKELQTNYKKQNSFSRKDGSALYTWLNQNGTNILYHGSCSITCFPMFLEIVSNESGMTPLYKKFNQAIPISK